MYMANKKIKTFHRAYRQGKFTLIEKPENAIRTSLRSDDAHRLKLFTFCLLFAINAALSSWAVAAQSFDGWRAVIVKSQGDYEQGKLPGEGMQFPHSMVRSHSNPEYIYWAHDCGQGWRSRNGGETWERFLAKGLGTIYGQSIEVDPANPNTVFITVDNLWDTVAAVDQGLYKSKDAGDNWEFALPVDYDENNRWYKHNIAYALSSISGGEAKIWYAAFANQGLYKSTDGGDNWTLATALSGHAPIYALYVHPGNSAILYLGSNMGLYISTDGGNTLTPLGDLPIGDVTSIQISPANPNELYVAVKDNGLYKSTNGGTTFSLLKSASNAVGCSINPGYPEVIYFLKRSGIKISQDGGLSWNGLVYHPRESLGRETGWGSSMTPWDGIAGIVPNPNNSGEAVGYGQAYLFKTTNCIDFYHANNLFSGYTWTCRDSMLFDSENPNRFGFFGADKGLFISENAGKYFELLETPLDILTDYGYAGNSNDLKAGAFQPGTNAFVASGGQIWGRGRMGIVWSPDNDGPWQATDATLNDRAYRNYFYNPDDPNILFVANVKSTDGGVSFSDVTYLVDNGLEIYGMCQSNSDIIYAANDVGNYIYRSIDGGDNFSLYINKVSYGYPSGAAMGNELVFDIDPVDCNKIYTLYNGDLASYDGNSWQMLGLLSYIRNLPDNNDLVSLHPHAKYPGITAVIVDPNNNSIIYAMVGHAGVSPVYRSTDGGNTWEDISYNLPRTNYAAALSINPHSGEIFVGSASGTWVFPPPYNQNTPIYTNSVSVDAENLPPHDRAPVLATIGNKSVSENSLLTFDVNATDADGDAITYTATGTAITAGAVLTGQSFSWTPNSTQAGTYKAEFTATAGGQTDFEIITITVYSGNNTPPVLASIGPKSGDEGLLIGFTASASDSDVPANSLTFSLINAPAGASIDSGTGMFTWTPTESQGPGSYDVTVRVTDDGAGNLYDEEVVTITVNEENASPTLSAIDSKFVDEGAQLTFTASASDTDVPGNTLTFSLINAPPVGASINAVTGVFTWTPAESQGPGSYNVTVRVTDNGVGSLYDQEAIKITVNEINVAPVLGPIDDQTIDVGSQLTFTANATDADVPANGLTFSLRNAPAGASIDPVSGKFTWTPSGGYGETFDVTVRVTDDGAGNLYDEESMTITIVPDETDPTVTNLSPQADSIQAPLNTLVILDITDSGDGVDANSVEIEVNGETVYSGNTTKHNSTYGECHRIGTKAHYAFIYQSNEMFDFDQPVSVTVNATDLKGNVMDEYSYSFRAEMRSFGRNKRVDPRDVKKGRPVTVCDNSGNIWAAWHAGVTDSRDIYIGKLEDGAVNFDSSVQLTSDAAECNPVTAVGSDGKLYVAWQDNRRGNWDIYISTSNDWSAEIRVTDSNDNQINPAIVVDSSLPNNAYIVWEDDRNGNQDIYIAKSSNGFATKTVSQITSNGSDQVEPAIAVDSDNTVYVVWTDTRNGGKNDIYGAASNSGPWTNVPIVTEEESQSSPAIATEAVGSILHLVWVDDRIVDANDDIFYAKTTDGLPGSPLTGSNIIDDTTDAGQKRPVIAVSGSTGSNLQVFVCWQDERDADDDLYLVEISSGNGTNVFVGDDSTNTDQTEPAIGIDGDGHPYLVWTDSRNTNTDIYYAGSTFIESKLASTNVSITSEATVGTMRNAIQSVDDVSAEVPQGAYLCDVEVTISRIKNPQEFNFERSTGVYEFGPSGMEFTKPVTITIPYEVNGSENVSYKAYWYNSLTNTLSQQGITNVETIVISSNLHALRFKTTHFSPFILGGALGGLGGLLGGGGGGGGCSMSPNSQDSIAELLLPYIGLAVAMVVLKLRDRRKRKAHNITKSGC